MSKDNLFAGRRFESDLPKLMKCIKIEEWNRKLKNEEYVKKKMKENTESAILVDFEEVERQRSEGKKSVGDRSNPRERSQQLVLIRVRALRHERQTPSRRHRQTERRCELKSTCI